MSDERSALLTDEEWAIYDLLSEVWRQYNELPELFVQDKWEFSLSINRMKNYILSRPVMRDLAHADWPGYINPDKPTDVQS
jgi:hypothetical protein